MFNKLYWVAVFEGGNPLQKGNFVEIDPSGYPCSTNNPNLIHFFHSKEKAEDYVKHFPDLKLMCVVIATEIKGH